MNNIKDFNATFGIGHKKKEDSRISTNVRHLQEVFAANVNFESQE